MDGSTPAYTGVLANLSEKLRAELWARKIVTSARAQGGQQIVGNHSVIIWNFVSQATLRRLSTPHKDSSCCGRNTSCVFDAMR